MDQIFTLPIVPSAASHLSHAEASEESLTKGIWECERLFFLRLGLYVTPGPGGAGHLKYLSMGTMRLRIYLQLI